MPTSDVADVPGGAEKVVTSVRLRRPDDWHVHLRDGAMLKSVVNYTARQFARAIVMPSLSPPITTAAAAKAYRERIVAALEPGLVFVPLMTCYLTDTIDASEVERGFAEGVFTACKLYPAHATTNSAHGVTDIRNIHSARLCTLCGEAEGLGHPDETVWGILCCSRFGGECR
ncbi:dihydroorotase, homodimeric type [Devosia psychrophila]|uniref:dihydroorotase n=1 Tax=Devosia psychrophila TaxID=728005 RepID=A0A1I1QNL8_9HYPH|nr:dihydroorotase, homodimeric type [Devosia psychrophila]